MEEKTTSTYSPSMYKFFYIDLCREINDLGGRGGGTCIAAGEGFLLLLLHLSLHHEFLCRQNFADLTLFYTLRGWRTMH
jgi:hypothetical protein